MTLSSCVEDLQRNWIVSKLFQTMYAKCRFSFKFVCQQLANRLEGNSIDRFKKFARLGTSLLIGDAITSISATMRGKRTSGDLAKSIYLFRDANPDYANSAIARIFSISESTLRGILKRRIGSSGRQKRETKTSMPSPPDEALNTFFEPIERTTNSIC